MPYCTVVEFDDSFDRERFEEFTKSAGGTESLPDGCLSRIVGIDDTGARVIEVWESGEAAMVFAQKTGPSLASADLPAPVRVFGFQATTYLVA